VRHAAKQAAILRNIKICLGDSSNGLHEEGGEHKIAGNQDERMSQTTLLGLIMFTHFTVNAPISGSVYRNNSMATMRPWGVQRNDPSHSFQES